MVSFSEAADANRLTRRVRKAVADDGLIRVNGFASFSGKPVRFAVLAVGIRISSSFDSSNGREFARRTKPVAIGLAGIDRISVEQTLTAAAEE